MRICFRAHPSTLAATAFCLTLAGTPLSAQTMSGDAREVGLAGFNRATELFAGGDTSSAQFEIPLGLLQLLADRRTLRPDSVEFDPAIALEYAAVPTHFVFGRQPSPARARFFADLREAGLNPDLNTYRGFKPVATLDGEGLLAPTWGRSFTVHGTPDTFTHRIYVGAGPYMSIQTSALFDQRLVNILGASTASYSPNSALEIGNHSSGQAAMQITGGYRGRVPIRAGSLDGHLEFEADYNHLHGFHYEDVDLNLRLDTNGQGFLALDRSRGAPLAIDRRFSSSGRGFAVDLASMAVFDHWRFSLSVDGIGNRIDWRNVRHREYELARLTGNASRVVSVRNEGIADVRETLPVSTRVQGAYVLDQWGVVAEVQHGFQGTTGGAGLQRQFSAVELRGGARLVNRIVLPAAGVSLKAGAAWFDIGAAVSTANIERQRNVVLATSIRFVFGQSLAPAPAAVQ